jgi:hypothetical protein
MQEDREAGGGDGDYDDIQWYTPKRGQAIGQTAESVIRILPHWSGNPDLPYWFRMHRHFNTIQLDGGKRTRLPRACPRLNTPDGQPVKRCPTCERAERAEQAGDKEMARELKAKVRFFFNVLDVENPSVHFPPGKQPRSLVYGASASLFNKLSNLMGTRGPIWHPQQGRMIKIYATKTGGEDRDVRYDLMDCSEPCPIPAGLEVAVPVPLDQLAAEKSYAEMEREIAPVFPDQAGMPVQQPAQGIAPPPPPHQAAPAYPSPYGQPAQPYQAAPVQPAPAWHGPPAQPAQAGPPPGWNTQGAPPPAYPVAQQHAPAAYQAAPPQQAAPPAYAQPPAWQPPPAAPPQGYPPGTQFDQYGRPIPF